MPRSDYKKTCHYTKNRESSIDHILLSEELAKSVQSILIDKEQNQTHTKAGVVNMQTNLFLKRPNKVKRKVFKVIKNFNKKATEHEILYNK